MKIYKLTAEQPFQRNIRNTVLIAALFLTAIISPQAYSYGQVADHSAETAAVIADQKNRANDLTQQIRSLVTESNASGSGLSTQLVTLAEERWQILGELIENDPAEVLKQALPDDVFDRMPVKAQTFLELRTELQGELQVLHADYNDQSQSHYVYRLTTDNGEHFSLHFAKQSPDIYSGTRVRINGVALYGVKTRDAGETDGAVAVDNAQADVQLLEAGEATSTTTSTSMTAVTPNSFDGQKTLVLLVNFQDNNTVKPWTLNQVNSLISGTVSDFIKENSYGQTWLTSTAYGWYTLNILSTQCDQYAIADAAKSAAITAGVDLSGYKHFIYVFPKNSCTWSGLSTVGGNPSESWVNNDFILRVVAHELLHGFGLFHSQGLDCSPGTLGSNCQKLAYGDTLDIMGGRVAHLNAFQKERLGWLNYDVSPPITIVEASGSYQLSSFEPGGTQPKALKILKSIDPITGNKTWYYLEQRQAIGFDSWILGDPYVDEQNVLNGVVLHLGTENAGDSSLLLDMTPDSPSIYGDLFDPALAVGQSYTDPDAGLTITADWADSSGVSVTVNLASVNHPPAAVNDSAATSQDKTITIPVLTNDTDPDGDPLSVKSVTQGTNGKVAINANGTVTYTPNLKFTGTDSFSYAVTDGMATVMATVSVSVSGKAGRVRR